MARNDPDGGAPAPASLTDMRQIWDGAEPKRCLVRIIDIQQVKTAAGPELRASFRNPRPAQKLVGGDIAKAIADAVRAAGPPRGFIARAKAAVARTKAFFAGPILSPLDIELRGQPTVVVFILGQPSNMRFNPTVMALTHKNPADRDGYGRLMHVGPTQDGYDATAAPREGCRIVHFVADPPREPPQPEPYKYKHGFNINVRLEHPSERDGTRRVLDLIIDPDIRYPGQ
ncbi:MAG TPA: nucleotide synthetase [Allosphingosinicella sp.]|nr:nucleotide synthetase [Allosphingosinicella sp.]